jgi:hypothetical protein
MIGTHARRIGWRSAALGLGALLLSACASRTGVVVATADGSERYVGERSRGARSDSFALTAASGADCGGELVPTTEAETGRPAAFGGVRCDDGRVGVLLFSETPGNGGGPVSGVIDRRGVRGRWGAGVGASETGA